MCISNHKKSAPSFSMSQAEIETCATLLKVSDTVADYLKEFRRYYATTKVNVHYLNVFEKRGTFTRFRWNFVNKWVL